MTWDETSGVDQIEHYRQNLKLLHIARSYCGMNDKQCLNCKKIIINRRT